MKKFKQISLGYEFYLGLYQQTLFDSVQSHAVYGLGDHNLAAVKEYLKSKGATKFRTVKCTGSGFRILCYRGTPIS